MIDWKNTLAGNLSHTSSANLPLVDKEAVTKYIIRLLWKKRKILRSHLLVHIYRFSCSALDLDEISSHLLGKIVTTLDSEGNEVKGKIESKGDGIRGVMGNGPVIYSWKDLTK